MGHHYVSRCQIRNFFNDEEGKIYIYNKVFNKYRYYQGVGSIFSEDGSNTRIVDDLPDNSSLEKDLKISYEDNFDENFQVIVNSICNKTITSEVQESVIELAKYGIAGEIRIPEEKRKQKELIADALFNQILPGAIDSLKTELEALKTRVERTKYLNSLNYSDFADTVFEKMRGINFVLYVIKCDQFFLFPDRPSITRRDRINDYYNPDIKEISMVGIPLSSKIYLHSESKKLRVVPDRIVELTTADIPKIEKINFCLYSQAIERVSCESENFLKNFISNIDRIKYSLSLMSD
ncbi:MAG: DUF4238 domain-containing protein [bacterium]|nr:DUF4238 domain-containing protein [bacterium]